MITRTQPDEFASAATVQVESDASDPWIAMEEVEDWAAANGFVRTSEYALRPVLIDGQRRFRGICYRISEEERAALEDAHRQMIQRGDALMRTGTIGNGTGG